MTVLFTNNASSTLASGISSGAGSFSVQSGAGALFPNPVNPSTGIAIDYFMVTAVRASDGAIEIMKCTARATDTLTVTRAQEGTTALALNTGDRIELRATANGLNNISGVASFRNRLINADMRIDQRHAGASQTIVAAASNAYAIDRFYASCTGANVTGQQVAGSTATDAFLYQFTGAASVTAIVFGQKIESNLASDLASTTVTLSVALANSVLTTVTWTAYYPTAVDNYTSRTQIATGTWTVSSTLTRFAANISLPSNVSNGLQIELSVGAQTSGTWQIGRMQLEAGSVATAFERRLIATELVMCQRYYEKSFGQATAPAQVQGAANSQIWICNSAGATANYSPSILFQQPKRVAPTTWTLYNPVNANAQVTNLDHASDGTASTQTNVSDRGFQISVTGNAAWVVGDRVLVGWSADAEL
jgi:hypothetical protein